jgi:uracil-DNA glycosylase family 4
MASTKQQQLDNIKAQIVADKVCPSLAKTAKHMVFGDGSPDAELVLIGEAPGKNEDEQGKPFVGAAGKFLNEMLDMIGLKREDIYITNIVKYRPPNNRDPLPGEKKEFLPYLQAQLEVIQPKVVATLGRHSLSCFLPDLQISQVHGQPKRIRINFGDGAGRQGASAMQDTSGGKVEDSAGKQAGTALVILPLFHPAAALYNNSMRQTLIDDFAKIPVVLAQTTR